MLSASFHFDMPCEQVVVCGMTLLAHLASYWMYLARFWSCLWFENVECEVVFRYICGNVFLSVISLLQTFSYLQFHCCAKQSHKEKLNKAPSDLNDTLHKFSNISEKDNCKSFPFKVYSQVWDNFWQLKTLLKWWKMLFISLWKLFSFSR